MIEHGLCYPPHRVFPCKIVRKREVRSAPFIRHFAELGRDISDMGATGKRTSTDFAS